MNTTDKDLEQYCRMALDAGVNDAMVISPSSVVTAPWVRMKCQFGCPLHGKGYCCPPHTPTHDMTRAILDAYRRAILFHIEAPKSPERGSRYRTLMEMLIDLEGTLFKDGYYKAFVFLAGPCSVCKACSKAAGDACRDRYKARPAMEACGIDVFQTARNSGFNIETLRDGTEPRNTFSLMLVD